MSPSERVAHVEGPEIDLRTLRWPGDYPALGDPAKAALIFEGQETSYEQLDRQASAFVRLVRDHGIGKGERVAYLGRNSAIYFSAVFGTFRSGIVLVPLNWRCTATELSFILADAGARLLICDPEFMEVAAQAAPSVPVVPTQGQGGLCDLLDTLEPARAELADPDETVMLMYTSGTTGKPKGVMISHRMYALARHVEILSPDYDGWTGDDVILSPMPNFHMGALSWMLGGFCRGLTCVLTADVTPGGLLDLCLQYSVNRTFIVPTVVRGMLEEMKIRGVMLPHLKEIHYGASPMDVALLRASMDGIGCQFLHHYGMTENAGTATRLGPLDHDPNRPHLLRSIGKPQPGLAIEIRRPDKSVASRGESGEIWIRSPTVMPGYWNRPEATAEAIENGWYRTGDGGFLDDEGFLFLTDRIKDMVVTGGENVYPIEVEAALRTHPAILDVAVFGMPDARWGEAVAAAVEFQPGLEVNEEELRTHVRGMIAGYKIPKHFILDIKLPRTATGKIQRVEAKKAFGSQLNIPT